MESIDDISACNEQAATVLPLIDRNRCEAKGPCVDVCPYGVFEINDVTSEQRRELSFVGKLKLWVHGGKQAFVVSPELCHACGLCVQACPERAIRLVNRSRLDADKLTTAT